MPLRRILLNLLSGLVVLVVGLSLWSSWFQAPPQTQLDLIQTNLSLQASRTLDDPDYQMVAQALLGRDVVETASKRYTQTTENLTARLTRIQESSEAPLTGLRRELDALRLRTGILAAYRQKPELALEIWDPISSPDLDVTANILEGLWGDPRRILPDPEVGIRAGLDGWFRGVALQRLYSLQQRADALNALNQDQEQRAVGALTRLIVVTALPGVGLILGILTLLSWLIWHAWRRRSLLGSPWQVPWGGIQLQGVLTGWFVAFFALGWLVPQLYVRALGIPPGQLTPLQRSLELLLTYASTAAAGLALVIAVVRQPVDPAQDPRQTSPEMLIPVALGDLWRVRFWDPWPLWGMGAYWAAMPLVLIAGVLSQLVLPDGGGGNPLLPLLLQSQGWGPRLVFFLVVSVCAPIFEELLFRGFVLPTLSKFLPLWGSLVLSGLLFAIAHLNLSDLLPLTALGIVLGLTYSRSRNLLAPMLLHSLWNTGSLLVLLVLGQPL